MLAQKQSYIYSLTKLLNEHLAIKFEARYGVPIISVRPPIVFGHGRKRGTTAWASDFVSLPTRGHAVTLPFPEDDWNCYIYVADLAEQIYQLSVKPSLSNRIYNSGGHTLAAAEFATLVREQLPGAEIRFSPNRPHSAFIYRLDDRRICSELGSRCAHARRDQGPHRGSSAEGFNPMSMDEFVEVCLRVAKPLSVDEFTRYD